jgi:acyl-coenzyme A thioesterase PaaI-like protein
VTLAFTTQFIRAGREGDELATLGAWRPSASQSTFACETEIYDQHKELIATGAGTFRYLKGERTDGTIAFLDDKAAD